MLTFRNFKGACLGTMDLLGRVFAGFLSLWIVGGSSFAETKVGNITITMQPGQCKASLNGVDIGCPSGAVHSRLENGRHIVNFPATDVASIGFAVRESKPQETYQALCGLTAPISINRDSMLMGNALLSAKRRAMSN
jgi:hypothetical protein